MSFVILPPSLLIAFAFAGLRDGCTPSRSGVAMASFLLPHLRSPSRRRRFPMLCLRLSAIVLCWQYVSSLCFATSGSRGEHPSSPILVGWPLPETPVHLPCGGSSACAAGCSGCHLIACVGACITKKSLTGSCISLLLSVLLQYYYCTVLLYCCLYCTVSQCLVKRRHFGAELFPLCYDNVCVSSQHAEHRQGKLYPGLPSPTLEVLVVRGRCSALTSNRVLSSYYLITAWCRPRLLCCVEKEPEFQPFYV